MYWQYAIWNKENKKRKNLKEKIGNCNFWKLTLCQRKIIGWRTFVFSPFSKTFFLNCCVILYYRSQMLFYDIVLYCTAHFDKNEKSFRQNNFNIFRLVIFVSIELLRSSFSSVPSRQKSEKRRRHFFEVFCRDSSRLKNGWARVHELYLHGVCGR